MDWPNVALIVGLAATSPMWFPLMLIAGFLVLALVLTLIMGLAGTIGFAINELYEWLRR
jgi:hypothetical protein